MKGIVFTEFLGMVDDTFGPVVTDSVVSDVDPPSGGVYMTLGTYSCEELIALLRTLEQRVGMTMPALLRTYGRHLFGRFVVHHPELIQRYYDSFSMLERLDDTIHKEVRRHYPDSELPRFTCRRESPDHMIMVYSSLRPLADLAQGMMEGCGQHFGEVVAIERTDHQDDKLNVSTFRLRRLPM